MTFLFGFIVVSGCAVAFLSTEEIYSLVQFSLSSPPQLEIDVQPPVSNGSGHHSQHVLAPVAAFGTGRK